MKSISFVKPVFLDDLVRVGNIYDGGYVINQRCIDRTEHLVGLGVNTDWSFESDFFQRRNTILVSCFDYSVSARKFFKNAVRSFYNPVESFFWLKAMIRFKMFFRANRKFYKKGITDYNNEYFIQLKDIFKMPGLDKAGEDTIFLKIDIEQSEFRIMKDVMSNSKAINGMVIEFHDLDILFDNFKNIINQLSLEFVVTHVHGNNCGETFTPDSIPRALEITLVKRHLIKDSELSANREVHYPIPGLDAPNEPTRADYVLNFN